MRQLATPCIQLLSMAGCLLLAGCGGGSPGAGPADPAIGPEQVHIHLAELARREAGMADLRAIKRLQRTFGYYLDQGLWDEAADLFAAGGSIEIGLDGVYQGQARVREYLYALGGGAPGLQPGQINEHMQLMPVITLDPGGTTAKGRWRALLMGGRFGQGAWWGEGPYENTYVKEAGVWKLDSVHWYQSVVVPYAGGWQVNEDMNGGQWVAAELPPDAPPTERYETWPATYLPAFHFPNPVLGAQPTDFAAGADPAAYATLTEAELAAEARRLLGSVTRLEDERAIEQLQRTYGFYIDEGFWEQAADLFAADGTIEVAGSGVFVGRDRVLEYLRSRGPEMPQEGVLGDRMQLQPVIHVGPDGRTARGRWRLFAQEARSGEYARWGVGVYENEYVKEGNVWKIRSLHAHHSMYTPYEDGWGVTGLPNAGPSADLPPDLPPTADYRAYPDAIPVPLHYPNPVTAPEPPAAAAGMAEQSLEQALDGLERRLGQLEDLYQLERLNSIYGYYLARNQWDDLAGIFAPDGTIEIAMRGIYAGAESVRRNLNLYGEQGIHHGLLHNHMQYQPVIHLSFDGESALMRSRAFSIMGQYETYSMWMGGVYENEYVKRDGVWQIQSDQQFNTYFATYADGWETLERRSPPGVTADNPPDRPPSQPFEMFPSAFVAPFHYPHPITGAVVEWPPEE